MATARVGTIELDYDQFGRVRDPAVLLICGLGTQRITWPDELLDGLVAHDLRVITFDNRDVGKSTILDHLGFSGASIAAVAAGQAQPPYTLGDMAADAVGLLDHLGLDAAHVVGVSMGGMIGQHMAFGHPARVRTLTSIMSTTGAPAVGQSTPAATAVLFKQPPKGRDAFIADAVARRRTLGSPAMFDADRAHEMAARVYDRGLHPWGTGRQLAAIFGDGDRTARLGGITAPTLAIHGAIDPLIDVSGGHATAAAIPGAQLLVVDDMGHDLPVPVIDQLVPAIVGHIITADDPRDEAGAA